MSVCLFVRAVKGKTASAINNKLGTKCFIAVARDSEPGHSFKDHLTIPYSGHVNNA